SCQPLCVLPTFEDVPSITKHTHLSFKTISISTFRDVVEDVCQQQTARISREVSNVHVAKPPEPKTQNDFLQYFCQVNLDPNTAHAKLNLSENNRKASCSFKVQKYPDHPERFDVYHFIMCKEGLYSRCYWEVECSGNDCVVAVCYKGIGRKGNTDDCRLGFNKKSWRLLGYYLQNFCFMHDKAQKELKEMKAACQKLIEERERSQQELSEAAKLLKSSAQETEEDIEKVFAELICSLEKKRSEIKEQIRAQEKTEIDRAEELHKHLDQELTQLRQTQTEIDKLLISDDQIHCLKSCQSVCVLPKCKDVPSFTKHTHLSFKDISISAFRDVLEDVCQQQTARISREVSNVHIAELPEPKMQNDFFQLSQSEDRLMCSVCLDRLKEPVTIPCGHSYCMSCITDCWEQKEQEPPYRCPQCRESFSQRPLLKKNTLIAEMMETLQKTSLQTAAVECDVCTTEKNRAVKSCLQCLASFCQTHLQLHYQSPAFMKHKLVEASRNIQENICLSHGKPLEMYCQDDHQCICCLCTDNHKRHSVVSVDTEWTSKTKELKEMKAACQKLIEERERSQQELSEAAKLLKSSAQEAEEDIEKVFAELICSLEKKRSEIKEQIRAQEKTEIDRAEELHKHLDQELTQLRQTQTEIDKLLISDDQMHFLKSCQSVCVLPTFEDVPSFTKHTHLSFKDISISAFREVLEDVCQQQTAKISQDVSNESPEPKTRNYFLQYFCDIHLDPNTAHKCLILYNVILGVFPPALDLLLIPQQSTNEG
ncbi:hypothetical protein QQF64_009038, partial [Cirrhinus molitorella]